MVSLGHVCPEDLAVSGIILTESHVEKALGDLHASHSDAIGAPKVCACCVVLEAIDFLCEEILIVHDFVYKHCY